MVVEIEKIIVKDRIRKDFGDIKELADDISTNGLINPPVVNKEYELLAGERRLRACKSLGWKQIEVHMMDTRDAEHELNVEISENDVRKDFTKSERVDYMKRLMRIEETKAKERMSDGGGSGVSGRQKSDNPSRTDDEVAKQFDVSRDTLRKEVAIVDNKGLLDPADFADWDEGKLSTNKAYQKIRHELDLAKSDLSIAKNEITALKNRPVKEVVKEVMPPDYEDKLKAAQYDAQRAAADFDKARKENAQYRKENEQLKAQLGADKVVREADRDIISFTTATNDYIRRYGGHVWAFNEIGNISDGTKQDFFKAIQTLDAFAQQLITNLGGVIDE